MAEQRRRSPSPGRPLEDSMPVKLGDDLDVAYEVDFYRRSGRRGPSPPVSGTTTSNDFVVGRPHLRCGYEIMLGDCLDILVQWTACQTPPRAEI